MRLASDVLLAIAHVTSHSTTASMHADNLASHFISLRMSHSRPTSIQDRIIWTWFCTLSWQLWWITSLGSHHGRAAQISRLQDWHGWQVAPGSVKSWTGITKDVILIVFFISALWRGQCMHNDSSPRYNQLFCHSESQCIFVLILLCDFFILREHFYLLPNCSHLIALTGQSLVSQSQGHNPETEIKQSKILKGCSQWQVMVVSEQGWRC